MSASDLSPAAAPGFESLQQAAQWFAVLASDEATEGDRTRWQSWLHERRENREAWRYVEKVSGQFDVLQPAADKHAARKALRAAGQPSSARRRLLGMVALASGAGLLGWAAADQASLRRMVLAWGADYRTGVGEIREFTLADGTRIWLNTASALSTDYGPRLRLVHLLAGEVLIETARDPERSFETETDHGRLTALGTRFVVRRHDDHTYLAVYEGRVAIRTADGAQDTILDAGEQTTFTRTRIAAPTPADRARQAWARGILVANDIPLHQLIDELARYRSGYLGCAPEVAGLRVMGTYSLSDPDRVLALLEAALPVKVRRTLPWWTTVGARD